MDAVTGGRRHAEARWGTQRLEVAEAAAALEEDAGGGEKKKRQSHER